MLALVPFVILGAAGLGLVSFRTQMGQSFTREPLLLVDPNVASAQDLEALPEIGQGTARAIVKERARGGRFRDARDFERRVDGIGPRTMELLAPHLRFEESQ